MTWAARLGDWISSRIQGRIDPRDVRAEAWALGGRHKGRVSEGAQIELRTPALSARRAILLRAVIRSEASKQRDAV